MATPAEIQAQLDPTELGAKILRSVHAEDQATDYDNHYVQGGIGYAGRCLWVATTASESAADQATAITAAMRAYR